MFVLSIVSISYNPTCFFNDGLQASKFFQKPTDKPSLSNTFDSIKISKMKFRPSSSVMDHSTLQTKIKKRRTVCIC